jgi:urease accessory protein
MEANYALQHQTVTVAPGEYLEYLPDITIPYCGSRFISRTHLNVAPDATLIYGEMMMSGRKHHRKDERFGYDLLSMETRLGRLEGSDLFAEKFVIEGGDPMLDAGAIVGSFDVFANILCATPPGIAARIQSRFQTDYTDSNFMGGLSRLPNEGGLMLRMVGTETHQIRPVLRRFWRIVREEARGRTLSDEFLWRRIARQRQ